MLFPRTLRFTSTPRRLAHFMRKRHEQNVAGQYDQLAHLYDNAYAGPLYEREDRIVARYLRSMIPKDSQVLDVGCGTGKGYELLPKPMTYVGVDISRKMLEVARHKYPSVTLIEASAERLPFGENEFDAVISTFGSLSHVADPVVAVQEIARVLRPNGKLFIMVYGPQTFNKKSRDSTHEPYKIRAFTHGQVDWTPAWRHSAQAIRQIVEDRFEIKYIRGLSLLPAHWKVPKLLSSIVDLLDRVLCLIMINTAQTIICAAIKK